MSQDDIYTLLKDKLLSGNFKYFKSRDIQKMLKDKGIDINLKTVNNNLMKLRCFGFLDTKIEADKNKHTKFLYVSYRLKKEALST
jgi:Fe2+ or Zn2+ uptake regulation protein